MLYCENCTKAVINIGGHTVIAPTRTAWVNPEDRGVQDLIDRELLVETDPPGEDAVVPPGRGDKQAPAAKADKEPSTVKELKAWLDEQGAQYSPSASKPELQGLYEALKAAAPGEGGGDTPAGGGSQDS
nr:MAG TPA: Thymopoietin protein [Caudoviricetes sp.]